MDLYAKKILGFLAANPNLDLEAADIAFHLKMDEQFVQNYIGVLLRQGVVINRRNEYGRVYWYACTKENQEADIPVMEPSAPVSVSDNGKKKDDDEFDEFLEKEDKKVPFLKILFLIALIAALGALGYLGLESVEKKLDSVTGLANSISKEAVRNSEYNQFKNESTLKIEKLETDLKNLVVMIDSLKAVIAKDEKQSSARSGKSVKRRK